MAWIGRVIMAAGAVGRMALGFIGVSLVAAAFIDPPRSGAPERTESIPPVGRTGTVTLRVPEGELTGQLTVVDEAGHQLALLTLWRNGSSLISAHRNGGIYLGCHFSNVGTPCSHLVVASRQTTVDVDRDGVITTTKGIPIPPGPAPDSEADLPDPPRPSWPDGLTGTARR